MTAVQASMVKTEVGTPTLTKISASKSMANNGVVKTVMSVPAQTKTAGEVRSRVVDTKKDKTEIAALLKRR